MGRYAGLRDARPPESRRASASVQPGLPRYQSGEGKGARLPGADTKQALSVLRSEEDTARRIEALRDLEEATDSFRDREAREAVQSLRQGAPDALGEAIDASLLRARLQDQVRTSSPGGSSAKAELAQQILLDGTADERLRFLEGTLEAEAVATLPALIEHLERESDPRVRTLVAKAIGAFGSSVDVGAFKSATRDPEAEVRVGAVEGLLYQRSKLALRLLLERLTDSEKTVREAAVRVLASYPMDEIVATLAGLPKGKGAKLKRGAVRVLKLYPDHPGAGKLLRRYLDSSSTLVSAEALVALASLGDELALARIMELDGRCEAKMQRVLDMAKEAYGAFSEVAVDELKEETSVANGVVSLPPPRPEPEPVPEPVPVPVPVPEADGEEDSGDWEVERPPTRSSSAPDELPSEADESPSDSHLAAQETVVGPAEAPPTAAVAETSGTENPWDSIAGPANPTLATAALREEAPAVSSAVPEELAGRPPTPTADEDHEEPIFPIPEGRSGEVPPASPSVPVSPDAATSAEPAPASPPTLTSPPRSAPPRSWRLAMLVILLTGVGGTGWLAYRAGVAQGQIDAKGEELRVEMNRMLQAIRNAEDGRGRDFRAEDLADLAAETLGEDQLDPWGHSYRYDPVLRRLISTGPDGLVDGAARYGQQDFAVDDEIRYLDAPPAPLGISFAGPTGFVLAAVRPGEVPIHTLTLGDREGPPVRPCFTPTMSRVAYLRERRDGTGFEAYFRRRRAGQAIAWDRPESLLPRGWTASELAWARQGEVVLAVARSTNGVEGLYGVEPRSQPILLTDELEDITNLRINADGKHFLLSAMRPSIHSLEGTRHVALGGLTGDGLSPGAVRFKWGPRGHTAVFTEDRGRILVLGPDPDSLRSEALVEFVPASDNGPASTRKLLGGIPSLTGAVLSRDLSLLAYCEGKNVVVMRLSTLDQTSVFVGPTVPSALVWPVPVNL